MLNQILRIGPAGLGPVETALSVLQEYRNLGFGACEISFTYGPYIKKDDALEIGKKAKVLGIRLSIHAPYFINLASADKEKRQRSIDKILKCCEIGHYLGAYCVVFHPGYYLDEEDNSAYEGTYELIRDAIIFMKAEIKKNGWKIKLAPETMGKVNVFGSYFQIARLVKDTGCYFCLDFAHILARDKIVDYEEISKLFGNFEDWHIHFSGINYTEKGEKSHKQTLDSEWQELLTHLPWRNAIGNIIDFTIINESPFMVDDCVSGIRINAELEHEG